MLKPVSNVWELTVIKPVLKVLGFTVIKPVPQVWVLNPCQRFGDLVRAKGLGIKFHAKGLGIKPEPKDWGLSPFQRFGD